MARPRSQFIRTIRSRRNTDWGFGVDFLDVQASATIKVLSTTSLTIAEQATIVRIRGMFHVFLEAAAAAGDGFLGAMGIALVNSDAFAAGVASVPGPLTDAHWDSWIWHSFFDVRALTTTLADGVNAQAASVRLPVDSKAMRKWDPAETLVGMFEVVESGTAIITVSGDTRILLKAA